MLYLRVPRIPTLYDDAIKQRGFELYARGQQLKEIAEQLNTPLNAVKSWSYRGQWKRRMILERHQKGGVERLPVEMGMAIREDDNDMEDAQFLINCEQLPFTEKQATFRDRMSIQALRVPELMATMSPHELLKNADRLYKLESIARRALHLEEPMLSPVINIELLRVDSPLPPLELAATEPDSAAVVND